MPNSYADLARQFTAQACATKQTPVDQALGLQAMFARLDSVMSAVVGDMGFRTVAARATHLARQSYPWISSGVTDGNASGKEFLLMGGILQTIEREGIAIAEEETAVVLQHIMILLADFIGADLTLRLVNGAGNGSSSYRATD